MLTEVVSMKQLSEKEKQEQTADGHVRKWLVPHNGRYWNVEEYAVEAERE
jgi:hypothetical protein